LGSFDHFVGAAEREMTYGAQFECGSLNQSRDKKADRASGPPVIFSRADLPRR
jgi:hypothetical protein